MMKRIALIVPVYNEADNLPLFMDQLVSYRSTWPVDSRVIVVDDGSEDATASLLAAYAARYDWFFYLRFSRNFGKEAALSAGLDACDEDAAICIDADLQHPLSTVNALIDRWQQGDVNMVYALRATANEGALKRVTSRWFYTVFNRMSNHKMPEGAGDFRLLDRNVIDALRQLPERNRFMKGLYSWVGFASAGVTYDQPQRARGRSKFNGWSLWNFALDGLSSFTTWPLRVWSYLGVVVALLAMCYGIAIALRTMIWGVDVPGYATLAVSIMFLGGMQLMSIGIIGEYLGRLVVEAKQRPLYIISEKKLPHDE